MISTTDVWTGHLGICRLWPGKVMPAGQHFGCFALPYIAEALNKLLSPNDEGYKEDLLAGYWMAYHSILNLVRTPPIAESLLQTMQALKFNSDSAEIVPLPDGRTDFRLSSLIEDAIVYQAYLDRPIEIGEFRFDIRNQFLKLSVGKMVLNDYVN